MRTRPMPVEHQVCQALSSGLSTNASSFSLPLPRLCRCCCFVPWCSLFFRTSFRFLHTMVPNLRYSTWLVWVSYNAAQVVLVGLSGGAAAESSVHHHPEPGIATLTQAGRGVINSRVEWQGQQPEMPAESRQGLDGGTNGEKNFLCRSRGRCLQAEEAAAAAAPPEVENPPITLPALPTDPEAAPAAPRTNPSTLVPPNSHPSGSSTAGGGGAAPLSTRSTMASKLSLTAGVGVSGLLLLVALLYYFKPDIFMCCKTCVRVQVFHRPRPTTK